MNGWHAYDEWERTMTMSPETRDVVREGAKRSAAAVLPMIFNMLGTPSALLDVGAGEGHWGIEAERLGVRKVLMIDHDPWIGIWNDNHGAHQFEVEPWNAETRDPLPPYGWLAGGQNVVGEPPSVFPSEMRWPLALCLEVAEHLTPSAGDHLVAELCRVADAIVWSAAIPGQGGDGHINEQWPQYWTNHFNAHGYVLDDPWRLDLWNEPDVEPWYAQNLLYAFKPAHGAPTSVPLAPLALVHPVTWAHHRGVPGPRS